MTKYLFFLFGISIISFNQSNSATLFTPLAANTFEARTGSFFQFGAEKLRLDIGASFDLHRFDLPDSGKVSVGGDFFTYTRLRSEGNFKFPVETSDFYFGVNGSYTGKIFGQNIGGRIRVAHISSHLSDGLAKGDSLFNPKSFAYSREFVELTGTITFESVRFYAGLNYVFSTKPKNPNPLIPELGFDMTIPVNSWLKFRAGYDFKLTGISRIYSGVNSAQAGLMFMTSDNAGVMLNLYGFDGRSIHGLFYQQRDSYLGVGFQFFF